MSIPPTVRTLTSLLTLPVVACGGSDPTDPSDDAETGSVRVTAVTTGDDLDSQYGVSVGSKSGTVSANGDVTISGVPAGSASVELTGVATNCTVTSANPVSVTVTAGGTATASFAVECAPLENADALIEAAIDAMEVAMFAALNIGGVSGLDDFSFGPANELFNQALTLSPSNDTASFGAAVTGIFMVEDDSDVRAVVEAWDAWLNDDVTTPPLAESLMAAAVASIRGPVSLPVSLSTRSLEQVAYSGEVAYELMSEPLLSGPPPSTEGTQTVLSEVVRPALIAALGHLEDIGDESFTFTVTEAMQGEDEIDADPLELDFTEVLAIQAGLHVALAAIDVATAYVLTPNPLSADGLVEALTPGSTFLTLSSEGSPLMSDALTRLRAAGPILLDGLDALEAESDDQTDDIIKYDPTGTGDGLTSQDIADARSIIGDVNDALSGPTVVTFQEGTPDELNITLDVAEFFTDPIGDFKGLLPSYEVFTAEEAGETVGVMRWIALNLDEWTVPDPTFSGVLPEMSTTADLFDLGFDELFFELSLTSGYYRLISINGADCLQSYQTSGTGCPVGSDFFYDGSIDLDGHDAASEVWLNVWGTSSVDAFGSYVVSDNMDGSYDVDMDMIIQDGTDTPLALTGLYGDDPGYTSIDEYGRARGGSSILITYMGAVWIFERSD